MVSEPVSSRKASTPQVHLARWPPNDVPSETKQGPEDRWGQFNKGTSSGAGGSAQNLERGRVAGGRAGGQLACANLGWAAQGTTPGLPSCFLLSPLWAAMLNRTRRAVRLEGLREAPSEPGCPPRHPSSC